MSLSTLRQQELSRIPFSLQLAIFLANRHTFRCRHNYANQHFLPAGLLLLVTGSFCWLTVLAYRAGLLSLTSILFCLPAYFCWLPAYPAGLLYARAGLVHAGLLFIFMPAWSMPAYFTFVPA